MAMNGSSRDLGDRLRSVVRGGVHTDLTTRGLYATDASHYQMAPRAVVTPRDEADVVATVAVASELGVPITGRGGGTSLAGQTFGPGIVLDFSRHMNAVLACDPDRRQVRVQPGLVRDHLNRQLLDHKLHFAPDPATSSRATVGGMIANNSSGTRSILYGKTVDHVIALRVLLADGTICSFTACDAAEWARRAARPDREGQLYRGVGDVIAAHRDQIIARFPKVMRRVGGYNLDEFVDDPSFERVVLDDELSPRPWNLSRLICGSEGTLAVILDATLRLMPTPGATALCIVHFDDLIESLRHVPAMLEHRPTTVELLDETIIDESLVNSSTRRLADFFEGRPRAVQIVEFMADDQADASAAAVRFAEAMRRLGIGTAHVLRRDAAAVARVWELRRLGVGLQSNVPGRRKPLDFIDDACVPVDRLAWYIQNLRDICQRRGVKMPICCHASVGVLHPKPMLDLHDPADRRLMREIAAEAFDLVRQCGGSFAGEHGDGLVRGEFIRPFFGDQLYDAFGQIKRLFDPTGLMNPGKILDTPSMTDNLRHGVPGYERRIAEVRANYQYREQGGFAMAVEQCNGLGACRKIGSGTMCPSYMATRDEKDSTRGRANALRLAMSGQLQQVGGLTGDAVIDVLALCLQCKACKSECPNAVDLSRLKSDVLQMRHDERGVPLGFRLMGELPRLARRVAGPAAPWVNAVQRWSPVRRLVQRLAGIDARRLPPAFARRPLESLVRRRRPAGGSLGEVVLFDDTYASYFEPHVGIAAIDLLEACGYRVTLARAGCCQRPRLSKGLVHAARRDGQRTLQRLLPFAQRGLPIVCLEPSCWSALTDDLPDLIDDAALGRTVARHTHLLDDFLAQRLADGQLDHVALSSGYERVLIHGHCHQKALGSTAAMASLFERVPRLQFTEVDSGCCGMAGSFGYEHRDLSLAIGEQRLFPAVRAAVARPDAAICANGFSCRHQIADACGVRARHWVELLAASSDARV